MLDPTKRQNPTELLQGPLLGKAREQQVVALPSIQRTLSSPCAGVGLCHHSAEIDRPPMTHAVPEMALGPTSGPASGKREGVMNRLLKPFRRTPSDSSGRSDKKAAAKAEGELNDMMKKSRVLMTNPFRRAVSSSDALADK